MKRLLSLFTLVAICGVYTFSYAQNLASTRVQPKNAVLEEFTGIHCGYCPEGHAIAKALLEEHPGRFLTVAIHAGGYAVPSTGEPDFRTEYGEPIDDLAGVTGYPAGTVNRYIFDDLVSSPGLSAMGRGAWTEAVNRILDETSPVNVGAESTFDPETRELTVNVELYYTSESAVEMNNINVAFLESGILGPQSGGGMGDMYEHNHMLRHLITGQWGDEIEAPGPDTKIERTYTYIVPEEFVVENSEIAVYVAEGQQNILSGVSVEANGGTSLVVAEKPHFSETILAGIDSEPTIFSSVIETSIPEETNYTLNLSSENAPEGWDAKYAVNGVEYAMDEEAKFTASASAPAVLEIKVTPDDSPAFSTYQIVINADEYTEAPDIQVQLDAVANVTDLIVHNQGAWTAGSPVDFEPDYVAGLEAANNSSYAAVPYSIFMRAADAGVLSDVGHIYFNVAWTFPSFNAEVVAVLSDFLDNGGNLFVAGQDIGWDNWADGGYGTDVTREFYTNYLSASYVDDGSFSNDEFSFMPTDELFGDYGGSSLKNVYSTGTDYMYPDEISPEGSATALTFYNGDPSKTSGVRYETGAFKTVYLGFEPSMIEDATLRTNFIKGVHDWFHNNEIVGLEEVARALSLNVHPNPVKDILQVNVEGFGNNKPLTIQVFNLLGEMVDKQELTTDNSIAKVDLSTVVPGVYLLEVSNGTDKITQKIQVVR